MKTLTQHTLKLLALVGCVLTASLVVAAQTYKPAIEYQSLMNLRFYEASGGFLVEKLQVVFPPAGIQKATFVVTTPSGEEVATVPLRYEKMEFPVFGTLLPDGVPGVVSIGRSGDFVMSVRIGGETITSLPFSIKEQTSSDPFKPESTFVREGPFRELAYFSVLPDAPNGEVKFNWWMSLRELPPGLKRPKVTIHLLAGGKEIAASRGAVIPSATDWQFFRHQQLSMPTQPRNRWLTLADLTSQKGAVTLVVKAEGQPFKSYKVQVAGGQFQRLPRNKLGAEPHAAFISPRFIDTSAGSSSRYKMFETYWVKKSDK